MLPQLEQISAAAIDAVNYRVKTLGEPLEDAVRVVESTLRGRGINVTLHLSTTSPAREFDSDNVAVYAVAA